MCFRRLDKNKEFKSIMFGSSSRLIKIKRDFQRDKAHSPVKLLLNFAPGFLRERNVGRALPVKQEFKKTAAKDRDGQATNLEYVAIFLIRKHPLKYNVTLLEDC